MTILEAVKDTLRPYKHALMRRPTTISWTATLGNLKKLGYEPEAVFDIGVAHGTWELYALYPRAYYYLCDLDDASLPHMERISRHLRGRVHLALAALSDTDGVAEAYVRPDLQGSTMFDSADGQLHGGRKVKVRTRRFDTLYTKFPAGALVKIDVQGAELLVLGGMTEAFHKIGAVLIEVSTISTLQGSPEVFDIMRFMFGQGFVLADIVGALRRPCDNQTAQMDLLFLPQDSPLRRNRGW